MVSLIRLVRRWLWAQQVIRCGHRGLWLSALGVAVLTAAHLYIAPVGTVLAYALAGPALLAGLLSGLVRGRPSLEQAATVVDRRLNADDLVVTAWYLRGRDEADRIGHAALIGRTAEALCRRRGAELRELRPRLPAGTLPLAALLAAAAVPLGQAHPSATPDTAGAALPGQTAGPPTAASTALSPRGLAALQEVLRATGPEHRRGQASGVSNVRAVAASAPRPTQTIDTPGVTGAPRARSAAANTAADFGAASSSGAAEGAIPELAEVMPVPVPRRADATGAEAVSGAPVARAALMEPSPAGGAAESAGVAPPAATTPPFHRPPRRPFAVAAYARRVSEVLP